MTFNLSTLNDKNDEFALASGIAAFEAKQFSRAVGLLAPLAERGEIQARYRVAIMAQNGLGMLPNPSMAYQYMRDAAAAGLDIAQHGLAFMYLQGECTQQDYTQAAEWFSKAAAQGLAGSLVALGHMHEKGLGIMRDPQEAMRLYQLAGFTDSPFQQNN